MSGLIFIARLKKLRDQSRPAGLVARADAAAGVAVEIFVEKHVVLEVRIGGKLGMILQRGALSVGAFEEEAREAAGEFVGDFGDGFELAAAGGAFDFEFVAIVVMEFLERLDEEVIHRHPDGAAPVGVAAEEAVARFSGPVGNFVRRATGMEALRLVLVDFREGAHAEVGQELRLVEHPTQEAFHAMAAQERERHATIDEDARAVDVVGVVAGQPDGGAADVVGFADTLRACPTLPC